MDLTRACGSTGEARIAGARVTHTQCAAGRCVSRWCRSSLRGCSVSKGTSASAPGTVAPRSTDTTDRQVSANLKASTPNKKMPTLTKLSAHRARIDQTKTADTSALGVGC
eukprot:122516-Rhodomonas_salina.3